MKIERFPWHSKGFEYMYISSLLLVVINAVIVAVISVAGQ